jgi:hypothetical protein
MKVPLLKVFEPILTYIQQLYLPIMSEQNGDNSSSVDGSGTAEIPVEGGPSTTTEEVEK